MEEKLSTELINYEFITQLIRYMLDEDASIKVKVNPANTGVFSTFVNSYMKSDDYLFKTTREALIVNDKDEYANGEVYDWLIGMAKFIKERNLVEDFKEFYMF